MLMTGHYVCSYLNRLDVPGLAEKRPSVLVGDYIQVRKPGTDIWYEGIVHAIMLNEVSLRFPNDFSTYRGNKFDVRFVLNRIPMRRMHQAVTYGQLQPRLLFPGLEHERPSFPPGISQTESIRPVNRIISGDEEQLTAIAAILYREPGSVPFVLFGP
jgi:helicase MOV-10